MSAAPHVLSSCAGHHPAGAGQRQAPAKRRLLHYPATVLLAALLVHAFFIEQFQVTTASMEPVFEPGQRVWVDKLTYALRPPRRFELIVFQGPDARPYVKRVIGLPGESVQLVGGRLNVDGVVLPAPVEYVCHGRHGVHTACRLAEGEFFVLGDNSRVSDDSRCWPEPGVKFEQIIGRPIAGRQSAPP